MPSKRPNIHFVSDDVTICELSEIARELDCSVAHILRMLVRHFINNFKFKDDPFEAHHEFLNELGYEE